MSKDLPPTSLTVVVPCYNEENTLQKCVDRILKLSSNDVMLEVIIVDDCSKDKSLDIARKLAAAHSVIHVLHHDVNRGKGAALRTGFKAATSDYVAVQDADLEYDPLEILELLTPLRDCRADVVYGSRFMGGRPHRVLYYWHSLGNSFLTTLSNIFTDLNLTDMETCYKVFKREVIQSIDIEEDRFGFEPEVTSKLAHRKLRIYEMGISYNGRTYEEGKKIGWKDGMRAIYCIVRYNAHKMPLPVQFLIYVFIGGVAAVVNLAIFLSMVSGGVLVEKSALIAFLIAAAVNYLLCILLPFRHKAQWGTFGEIVAYMIVVAATCALDVGITKAVYTMGFAAWFAKCAATVIGLFFNFVGRRQFVFRERVNVQPQ